MSGAIAATNEVMLPPPTCSATRLPPYGREVETSTGNVYVHAGLHAWERARARRASFGAGSVLVLPPDEPATAFRWPKVSSGLLIDARDISRQDALKLAACIVAAGTPLAFVVRNGEGFPVVSPTWCNPLGTPRRAG